jgi:ribosomal protein L23
MAQYTLVQTEKSYKVQGDNFYLIGFPDKNFTPNKIEVKKMLVKDGLHPLKITIVNPYSKLKRRGKKNSMVAQKRFKKYYVKLQPGEKIEETKEENTLN